MHVQIVGAGSVGLLVASYLSDLGFAVTVICRNAVQREQLQQTGVTRIAIDGSVTHHNIKACERLRTDVALTILTTKSHQLASVYEQLCQLPADMALLFMQNGLAHYEKALSLPQSHIAFASVQFGALKEQATTVRHTGIGVVKLAVAKGDASKFAFPNELQHFPFAYETDAYHMLFEKALLNCFINPLTTILQVKNGVLVTNDYAFKLMQQLYAELQLAFPIEMQQFPFDMVVALCEKTALNHSSMLMDRIHERASEIDAIVWPIVKRAKQEGKQLSVLQTLYYIVKAIEMERERST